jgi:hypothetical protein
MLPGNWSKEIFEAEIFGKICKRILNRKPCPDNLRKGFLSNVEDA